MRFRSRFMSVVVVAALASSMLPALPASGVTESGGVTSTVPSKVPTVRTITRADGIAVLVSDLSPDVDGYDVFRSEAQGVEGERLNSQPIVDSRFVDTTARPGVAYYYSIRVIDRKEAAASAASRYDTPDVLPQIRAAVVPLLGGGGTPSSDGALAAEQLEKPAAVPAPPGDPVPAAATAGIAAVTYGTPAGSTTMTSSTVWTPAKGPYFIRGDLVVPAGRTLTILPGTKVYFDTASSGVATSVPTPGVSSVTARIDLIVHGKLVANGTAAQPILFSSIRSTIPSAAVAGAAAGDWGCVFTDSRAASTVTYCQFEYGRYGVWAHDTMRPYIKNSVFRMNSSSGAWPWGAVSFTNPPAADAVTPRIIISNNRIAAPSTGEGVDVLLQSPGTSTVNRVCDVYITGNTITGPWPLEVYCRDYPLTGTHGGQYGSVIIKGTIANNRISTSSYGMYFSASAVGDNKSTTIAPVLSGNITSSAYNALYASAYAGGVNGSTYIRPTSTRDRWTSTLSAAAWMSAWTTTAPTGTGSALITPKLTSSVANAGGSDALWAFAQAYGTGTASTACNIVGGQYASTAGNAFDLSATSGQGSAYASPVFSNVAASTSASFECVSASADASSAGNAVASPRWTGGRINSRDDAFKLVAESKQGNATTNPYVYNAEVRAEENCIDAVAEASSIGSGVGAATVSPIVSSCDFLANAYDALYLAADAGGTGGATCSPSITNSAIGADGYYGVEATADSRAGAATVSPRLTDTTLWSHRSGLWAMAQRSGSGMAVGHATVSPRLTRVTAVAANEDAVYLDARNAASGNASVKPAVAYCDVVNSFDYDGMYAAADADAGSAEVSPIVTGSNFKSDLNAVELDADSHSGAATQNGTFTACTLSSVADNGYLGTANSSGASTVKPVFTNCIFEAPDDHALEANADATGTAGFALSAPTVSGGRVAHSGDGVATRAWANNTTGVANATVAPVLRNVPILATWGNGILTHALSYSQGNAYNNSYVYNSPVTSMLGITHESVVAMGAPGDAFNNARTLGVSSARRMPVVSSDSRGVYLYTSSPAGNVADRTQTKYLNINSAGSAVYSNSLIAAAGKTVTSSPLIYGVATGDVWGANGGPALYVRSEASAGSTGTLTPNISANVVNTPLATGLLVLGQGAGTVIASPSITGNSITQPNANGIEVAADDGAPSISRNTITRAQQDGILLTGLTGGSVAQNRILDPGFGWYRVDGLISSGLSWTGADPAKASVTSNSITGVRGMGIYFADGAARTNYNLFTDAAGNLNRPFNYGTNVVATSPKTPFDARYNWWGASSSAVVSGTISVGDRYGVAGYAGPKTDIVDFSAPLGSLRPRVSSVVVGKTTTRLKFTIRFDRPMNKAIRKLYFGATSPYRLYSVTGSWSADGMTFVGSRSRSGLPVGRTLYFSGAKDLWGNVLLPTSKGFRL